MNISLDYFFNINLLNKAESVGKVYTEGTPAFLPSSLTNIGPDALGFSPHPPVSVCGTGTMAHDFDAFLGTLVHANFRCRISPCVRDYSLTPHLLRGSSVKHRLDGFAFQATLRAQRRAYSQHARATIMRPA